MKSGNPSQKAERSIWTHEWIHWIIAGVFVATAVLIADQLDLARLEAALFVATGALAGYLTNDIAVTLLFWPTEKKLGGLLQGIFFKRKEAFGHALIDTACKGFLNPELFGRLIQDKAVEQALHGSVRGALLELASKEPGTPRILLGEVLADTDQREELLDRVAAGMGNGIAQLALDNATEDNISEACRMAFDRAGEVTVSGLISDEEVVASVVHRVVATLSEGWQGDTLKEWATSGFEVVLSWEKRLSEIIHEDMRRSIRDLGKDYVKDVALRELNSFLEDPESRRRIEHLVHAEVEKFIHSNMDGLTGLKGRLIRAFGARDIEEALSKVPNAVNEFLSGLPELLSRPEIQDYVGDMLNRSMERIWELRLSDLKPWLPKESVERIVETGLDALNCDQVRNEVATFVARWVSENGDESLGKLFPLLFTANDEREELFRAIAKRMATLIDDPANRPAIALRSRIVTRKVVVGFLDSPLPRLIDLPFITPRGLDGLASAAANLTVAKLRDFGPGLVEHFPIAERLNELWDSLDNKRIQSTVHGVLANEFQLLVNLGISFGSFVAFVSLVLKSLGGAVAAAIIWIMIVIAYRLFKRRINMSKAP
ncbi:DUF445 family protein [Thermodesulfobacteriota bacterium]